MFPDEGIFLSSNLVYLHVSSYYIFDSRKYSSEYCQFSFDPLTSNKERCTSQNGAMAINRDSNHESTCDGVRVSPPVPPLHIAKSTLFRSEIYGSKTRTATRSCLAPCRILMERRIRPLLSLSPDLSQELLVVSACRGR